MKLEKVNKELYATEDLRYTLKKDFLRTSKGYSRIWKLYCEGNYIGMPDTIKYANEIIKYREKEINERGENV